MIHQVKAFMKYKYKTRNIYKDRDTFQILQEVCLKSLQIHRSDSCKSVALQGVQGHRQQNLR